MSDNPQDCRVFWALWIVEECYIIKRHVSVIEDVSSSTLDSVEVRWSSTPFLVNHNVIELAQD